MPAVQAYMSTSRRLELRDQAKEMFFHGWNTYLNVAYPEDELRPLTCRGLGSTRYSNDNSNDVLGDYSLTLVDTLDTLAMIGTQEQFEDAVRRVLTDVSFDKNNKVQVFELNIRALGGLLSAHILATEPAYGRQIKGYQGGLLDLAVDLADRFLPAFYKSKTGIPFPRVNLRYGVPRSETVETCTAGAGSLILEFGVLSRLTGNPEYERVAKHALLALWEQRSSLNLMGNVIDIQTGEWILPMASTGAGIDSFYEYLLKAYVLFGDKEYLDVFDTAYEAIMRHVVDRSGFLYRNVHMQSGALLATWIDSLSAFMPGLQVLYGDLDAAIKGHLVFFNLWRRYHALPERYDFYQQDINIGYYPLRPEFVESNYYLYRATKDPFYLQVGEMVLLDLNNRSRIDCGFASMGNVLDGRLEDRMESFMLSETLKYLYLLFDAEHPVNSLDNNFVFTTEGHFLPLASDYLTTLSEPKINTNETRPLETTRPSKHTRSTCPKYQPRGFRDLANATGSLAVHQVAKPRAFDLSSLPYHPLYDYAAGIMQYGHNASDPFAQTAALTDPELTSMRHRHGHCSHPILYQHRYELTFGTDNRPAYQQTTPQILEMIGGLLTKSFSGLRLELLKLPRSQGGGYIVAGG
ncbi:hypothetical protein DM01DRAFT_1376194 [Hesseltinella vesiculosa]|uniref:alpha-1,2-Mannosidase n=1 Tax=Hesseltinella vesiculosa TaxID=101127 RepID=A0A1X2GBI2_9FUNG|nr:hypothetical protein DM01DRAFT_1376194 [Hesseltinella vesiculosa]